jgi:ABC-2 type transport system permease protein
VARSLAESFTAQIKAVQLSVESTVRAGAPYSSAGQLAAQASAVRLPEQTATQPAGTQALTGTSYRAPAMGIFFMFFAIGFGARGFFLERTGGTLGRLAAAPIGPGTILAGKSLASFVYGVASLGTVAVVTSDLTGGAAWTAVTVPLMAILAFALSSGAVAFSLRRPVADL